MFDQVELTVSPSCYNCLAWSADGEIALAAGEYVQILTPKKPTQGKEESGSDRPKCEPAWHITRFRANLFTNREWPTVFPQNRDDFSIGVELSQSSVVGLSWSPPGLARHRRCTLAVLTSNLLLSFYQLVDGKWMRVAIVNNALAAHFNSLIHDEGPRLRKTNIREFAWCPPLKVPQDQNNSVLAAESRWGFQILTISNDDNDLIFLHVRRAEADSALSSYSFDIISISSVHDPAAKYPIVQSGSILATTLKSKMRISGLSSGPWLLKQDEMAPDVYHVIGNAAATYGTKLKLVRLEVNLRRDDEDSEAPSGWNLQATASEIPDLSSKDAGERIYRGPLEWFQAAESGEIGLAVTTVGALMVVSLPRAVYEGKETSSGKIRTREYPLFENTDAAIEKTEARHWESISAMTVASDDESKLSSLHLGTSGGHAAAKELIEFTDAQDDGLLSPPPWQAQFDAMRERFDIDHDLGGLATGRIWGLAAYDGLIAVAFTLHPGDMIEYRTGSQERTIIVFSKANLHQQPHTPSFLRELPVFTSDFLRLRREVVLRFTLRSLDHDDRNPWYQKLVYAAACCALVESQDESLLLQAREVFEWLATATGVDLTEELTKCSSPGNKLESKSVEQLDGAGGHIFEKCDICQAGVAWYSAQEAQCAGGHLFGRCNLSYFSIQEPGVSKFCSDCGTEYLNEAALAQLHGTELHSAYQKLSNVFDTCIYCGGKFRA
ncbi:hypothetical protein IFM51744_01213 [Aspergillus udagawae]|uniref:Transcription factor tau subunit sfc9 n=1 Tax=Aspergillus udagawae TaxID=91492 RepID=A0ABQ1AAQ8_9EURO|nr:hypothetical protein IFM51744_01213 [Aspergillus udagawae]GFF77632.1 hypothetical protein IFM53868_02139 [Aspergillus udagawae]